MSRPSCKELLLDAAEAVVVREGGARLTLDAVAEQAGVSKGGLLYHFPSKESLLQGMISRHVKRVGERQAAALASLPEGSSSALKAQVLASLMRSEADMLVSSALLAVVANDTKLLEPAVQFHRERFMTLAGEGADDAFARRALIMLAADGLFFLDLLRLSPFTAAQRQALIDAMMRMTDEVSEA